MKRLAEVDRDNLVWTRPTSTVYELVSGREVVGRLQWERGWGSKVVAEAVDGKWFFRLKGILHPHITITEYSSFAPISSLKINVGREGVMDLPDGRRFYWVQINWWKGEWAFTDFNGFKVVRVRSNFGVVRNEPTVTIDWTCASLPHLSMLLLLGWYSLLLKGTKVTPPNLLI